MLPSPFPSSQISSRYGQRDIGFHTGTDWRCGVGTPIYASGPGFIDYAGWNNNRAGWVKTVAYDGVPRSRWPMYCHLNGIGGTQAGHRFNTGDIIAYSGNSGNVTGPHLHVELLHGGDPLLFVFDEHRSAGQGRPAGGFDEQESDDMSAEAEAAIFEIRQLLTETEQWKGIGFLVSEIYSIVGEIRQVLREEDQWMGMDARLTRVMGLVEQLSSVPD